MKLDTNAPKYIFIFILSNAHNHFKISYIVETYLMVSFYLLNIGCESY